MSIIDKALSALDDVEREEYIEWLRDVVGGPGVGGHGQYLGSLAPLVFATSAQKAEALSKMSEHNDNQG
jgi:hypothetical protein